MCRYSHATHEHQQGLSELRHGFLGGRSALADRTNSTANIIDSTSSLSRFDKTTAGSGLSRFAPHATQHQTAAVQASETSEPLVAAAAPATVGQTAAHTSSAQALTIPPDGQQAAVPSQLGSIDGHPGGISAIRSSGPSLLPGSPMGHTSICCSSCHAGPLLCWLCPCWGIQCFPLCNAAITIWLSLPVSWLWAVCLFSRVRDVWQLLPQQALSTACSLSRPLQQAIQQSFSGMMQPNAGACPFPILRVCKWAGWARRGVPACAFQCPCIIHGLKGKSRFNALSFLTICLAHFGALDSLLLARVQLH